MELAKCKCSYEGNTCCDDEPMNYCNTEYKYVIESLEDFRNNQKYIDNERREYDKKFSRLCDQEKENLNGLRTFFLSSFIDNDKSINGVCVKWCIGLEDTHSKETYLYINGIDKRKIYSRGIEVCGVLVEVEKIGDTFEMYNVKCINHFYVEYETLCSSQIPKEEFIKVYDKAIMIISEKLETKKNQ